ncbi:MAG: pentapeptide repeat-containing protein, partial [Actinobacteria bacterium]|nr:pentapeptide repeat-containing protein [Actinomycetota bacterium]
DLTGADLRAALLADATLAGANLNGVLWDKETTWPESFTPPKSV